MNATQRLPRGLRRRAEHLLDRDLSDVRLRVGPEAGALGALAFTRGREIHLAPQALSRSPRAFAWLVGHELAHVAQQDAGRVEPDTRLLGLPASIDARHEAEADAFAADLVAGRAWHGPRGSSRGRPRTVIQRAVHVGDVQLRAEGEAPLDERQRHVLDLIEGGRAWLEWAQRGPQAFEFADPEALLEGVQVGLHGRPAMLLPRTRLEVSPLKLLELNRAELLTLVDYERRRATVPRARIDALLTRHRLRSQEALSLGRRHLDSLGLGSLPLFHTLALDDAIEIYELVDGLSGATRAAHANQREAALFAAGLAGSPREFADYHRFYMAFLDKLVRPRAGDANGARARHADEARGLVKALLPLAWDLLKCPWFETPPRADELPTTLRRLAFGRPLGFGRVSSAICQVFAQAELDGREPDPAALVEAYRREITVFLREVESASASLSQDGLSRSFVVRSPSGVGRLELGPGGLLALERFARNVHVH